MVRLTDRADMTLDVYRGRKTTIQQQPNSASIDYPVHVCVLVSTHAQFAQTINLTFSRVDLNTIAQHIHLEKCNSSILVPKPHPSFLKVI